MMSKKSQRNKRRRNSKKKIKREREAKKKVEEKVSMKPKKVLVNRGISFQNKLCAAFGGKVKH